MINAEANSKATRSNDDVQCAVQYAVTQKNRICLQTGSVLNVEGNSA